MRAWIPTLLLACSPDSLLPEGPLERDPPRPSLDSAVLDTADTGAPGDPGTDDTGEDDTDTDTDPVDPEPTGDQVCYPGADWSYTMCFDLVEMTPDWSADYAYPEPYGGSDQYTAPVRFIDLESADAGAALAPNFVLSEFMALYKGRYGVAQVHLLESMQDLRDESGGPIYVNSAYRSPAYNATVGGVEHSRHMYGDSVDMTSGVLSLEALGALCDTLGADYVGYYETHIHCDWRGTPLDSAFYDNAGTAAMTEAETHASLVRSGPMWTAPASGFDEGEPLRIWEAHSAAGELLLRTTGRHFEPPPETDRVSVVVGGQVSLEVSALR